VWRGNEPQPGWTHVTSTAMIYARRDQPVSDGVRVQVRDIQLFVKPRSLGAWCLLDTRAAPGEGCMWKISMAMRICTMPRAPKQAAG
jgi:hypothetical protein